MTNKMEHRRSGHYLEQTIELFPGVMVQHYVCSGGYSWNSRPKYLVHEDVLLHHCRYGRFEAMLGNGIYQSHGMGQMTLSSSLCNLMHALIPAALYEGISIIFDYKKFPPWLKVLFSGWDIDFPGIIAAFNLADRWYYIDSNSKMEKSFLELYDLFDENSQPLMQLKVMELLYYITGCRIVKKSVAILPETNSKIVKRICAEMVHTAVPISELVSQEDISYDLFQKVFKSLYGTTPHLYRQEFKMNKAAALLKNTEKSVLEIALEQGYENPSKFASVFKKIIGLSPREYRKLER